MCAFAFLFEFLEWALGKRCIDSFKAQWNFFRFKVENGFNEYVPLIWYSNKLFSGRLGWILGQKIYFKTENVNFLVSLPFFTFYSSEFLSTIITILVHLEAQNYCHMAMHMKHRVFNLWSKHMVFTSGMMISHMSHGTCLQSMKHMAKWIKWAWWSFTKCNA